VKTEECETHVVPQQRPGAPFGHSLGPLSQVSEVMGFFELRHATQGGILTCVSFATTNFVKD